MGTRGKDGTNGNKSEFKWEQGRQKGIRGTIMGTRGKDGTNGNKSEFKWGTRETKGNKGNNNGNKGKGWNKWEQK